MIRDDSIAGDEPSQRLYRRWLLELWQGDMGAASELIAARWTGRGSSAGGEMRLVGHDLLRVQDGRFAEYWGRLLERELTWSGWARRPHASCGRRWGQPID